MQKRLLPLVVLLLCSCSTQSNVKLIKFRDDVATRAETKVGFASLKRVNNAESNLKSLDASLGQLSNRVTTLEKDLNRQKKLVVQQGSRIQRLESALSAVAKALLVQQETSTEHSNTLKEALKSNHALLDSFEKLHQAIIEGSNFAKSIDDTAGSRFQKIEESTTVELKKIADRMVALEAKLNQLR